MSESRIGQPLPEGCTLLPEILMAIDKTKEHPCDRCNEDRAVCFGLMQLEPQRSITRLDISLPFEGDLIQRANADATPAKQLVISTVEHYTDAAAILKRVKGNLKSLVDERKALTLPVDGVKKAIMDAYRPATELLEQAEVAIKKAIATFEAEQERLRKAEEERLREIQRKEQQRLLAAAKKAEEEARAKETELKRQAEEARAASDFAKAEKLAAKAEAVVIAAEMKSENLMVQAETMPTAIVADSYRRPSGLSSSVIWKARVTNIDLVPRSYLIANQAALDGVAKATKGEIKIDGVEFYSETSMRSGRA